MYPRLVERGEGGGGEGGGEGVGRREGEREIPFSSSYKAMVLSNLDCHLMT